MYKCYRTDCRWEISSHEVECGIAPRSILGTWVLECLATPVQPVPCTWYSVLCTWYSVLCTTPRSILSFLGMFVSSLFHICRHLHLCSWKTNIDRYIFFQIKCIFFTRNEMFQAAVGHSRFSFRMHGGRVHRCWLIWYMILLYDIVILRYVLIYIMIYRINIFFLFDDM